MAARNESHELEALARFQERRLQQQQQTYETMYTQHVSQELEDKTEESENFRRQQEEDIFIQDSIRLVEYLRSQQQPEEEENFVGDENNSQLLESSDDPDELLVEEVRKYRCLWDTRCRSL